MNSFRHLLEPIPLIPSAEGRAISDRLLLDAPALFGEERMEALCLVLARCNMACPGCYRGSQHVNPKTGFTVGASTIELRDVLDAFFEGMTSGGAYPGIRKIPYLTGGDPSSFPRICLRIATYFASRETPIGFAHNGFSEKFARKLAPYSCYAAIDFKAATAGSFSVQTGVNARDYPIYLRQFVGVIEALAAEDVFTEIRMPVFSNTTTAELGTPAEMISGLRRSTRTILLYRAQTPNEHSETAGPGWDWLNDQVRRISARIPEMTLGCMDGFSLERRYQLYQSGRLESEHDPEKQLSFDKLKTDGIPFHRRVR